MKEKMISTVASRNLKSPVKMASPANVSHSATLSKKSRQQEMVTSAKASSDDRFQLEDRSERSTVSIWDTLYSFGFNRQLFIHVLIFKFHHNPFFEIVYDPSAYYFDVDRIDVIFHFIFFM